MVKIQTILAWYGITTTKKESELMAFQCEGPELFLYKVIADKDHETVSQIGRLFASHYATNGFRLGDSNISDQHFFALKDSRGTLIAAAAGRIDEEDSAVFKLLNLYVSFQNRRLGIGSWLLRVLENEVRAILIQKNPSLNKLKIRVIPGGGSSDFYKLNGYEGDGWPLFKYLSL